MFCWNCGSELTEDANLCSECGAPVVKTADTTLQESGNTAPSENQAQKNGISQMADDMAQASVTETAQDEVKIQTENFEIAAADNNAGAGLIPDDTGKDIIIRKNHLSLLNGELHISGTYYRKKEHRFKKIKGSTQIPLSSISDSSFLKTSLMGKRVVSFLLTVIFFCGTLAAGSLGLEAYRAYSAPYRQEQAAQLEEMLDRLEHGRDEEFGKLDLQLKEIKEKTVLLEALLKEYQNGQHLELMEQTAVNLDLDRIFSESYFEDAFIQYITDLLDAFKNDRMLDDWLYPYYVHTVEAGKNRYISRDRNLDMWFYGMPDDGKKFTDDVETTDAFFHTVGDFGLYDLIYYYGRIYLSASDMMNLILMMPRYVADGAVFVKAYGGNPNPGNMCVPGWNTYDYDLFWKNADKYVTRSYPMWEDYGLSAEDFDLDWNGLVDEQAYYSAYVKFMDTIAPGLSVYDKVSYYGCDDAFGGMGFDIIGKEAAPTEIALLYLENHPEAMEALGLIFSTSFDDRILDAKTQLELLRLQTDELTSQKEELSAFFLSGDSLYDEYDALMSDVESHRTELAGNLMLYIGIGGFLCLMTVILLCLFIRYLKKPSHLLVLNPADAAAIAFSTAFCSRKMLAELQNRISRKHPDQPLSISTPHDPQI